MFMGICENISLMIVVFVMILIIFLMSLLFVFEWLCGCNVWWVVL